MFIIMHFHEFVSDENSLHVHHHAFSRPFHYALFGSLASLKIIPLVAPAILSTFFFNQFISRIENKFKPPRSDRGFLFEGLS